MACSREDPKYSAAVSGLCQIVGFQDVWELLGLTGERGMFIKFKFLCRDSSAELFHILEAI